MVKKDEKKAAEIRDKISKWRAYWKRNIDHYHKMHNFVLGSQWDDDEKRTMLKTYNKTALSFNKLGTLIKTLLGEQQQNTPQLEVVPSDECDERTAKIREIVVKDLMLKDETRTVYQVAAKQAFIGGFGAFIIDTKYTHDESFDESITYRNMNDPTNAYWDVSAELIDKTDGMYGGYTVETSRERFKAQHGSKVAGNISKDNDYAARTDTDTSSKQTKSGESDGNMIWSDGETITIIHHYEREFKTETIYKLSNGDVVDQDELDDIVEASKIEAMRYMEMATMSDDDDTYNSYVQAIEDNADEINDDIVTLFVDGMPVRIEQKRTLKKSKIRHYKVAGNYILETQEFPSQDIPVVMVDLDSYYDKNGKQITKAYLDDAVDTQTYINWLGTQSAYLLKISRYDQWVGSKKNVQSNDTQAAWRDPQNVQGILAYDESPSGAKPEQVRPPELSQSLITQYQRAMEDIYTCTGLYPSRLGDQGNEVSGAAIDARTRQGSYATYIAFNAINRAITAGGKIVNQMIPTVYDTERLMTVMTQDAGRKQITVNKQMDEYGEVIENDLRRGTFEVKLQAGPSYEGQKAQALESLNMIIQSDPSLFKIFGDLYAENLPLMNTIEIKNRLKTLVPKEIIEAGETGESPQNAQQPNARDQAALMMAQEKKRENDIKQAAVEQKQQEATLKYQQAMEELRIEHEKVLADLEGDKLRYLGETERTEADRAIARANNITDLLTSKHQ